MTIIVTSDMLVDQMGEIANERDTYRELCGELLEDLKSQVVTFEYAMGKSSLRDSNELIDKAEKLLGEKK